MSQKSADKLASAARGGDRDAATEVCRRTAPADLTALIEILWPEPQRMPDRRFDLMADVFDDYCFERSMAEEPAKTASV